jgi:hypothetical protein
MSWQGLDFVIVASLARVYRIWQSAKVETFMAADGIAAATWSVARSVLLFKTCFDTRAELVLIVLLLRE